MRSLGETAISEEFPPKNLKPGIKVCFYREKRRGKRGLTGQINDYFKEKIATMIDHIRIGMFLGKYEISYFERSNENFCFNG